MIEYLTGLGICIISEFLNEFYVSFFQLELIFSSLKNTEVILEMSHSFSLDSSNNGFSFSLFKKRVLRAIARTEMNRLNGSLPLNIVVLVVSTSLQGNYYGIELSSFFYFLSIFHPFPK